MFGLQQWAVIGVVAAACLGPMALTIHRMFSRRGDVEKATERRATAFESALIAEPPAGVVGYDGFSYRVTARFAGKVRVVVGDGAVVVAGPRVPRGIYVLWIWVQGLLLALVPPLLAWALVALDWRPLLWGLGIGIVSLGISSLGAGLWPGLGEMPFLTDGVHTGLEVPLSSVSDVAVGEGWARGGMETVLLPYKRGIDALAAEHAVSWFASDERGVLVRFAVHLHDADAASQLAEQLRAGNA